MNKQINKRINKQTNKQQINEHTKNKKKNKHNEYLPPKYSFISGHFSLTLPNPEAFPILARW